MRAQAVTNNSVCIFRANGTRHSAVASRAVLPLCSQIWSLQLCTPARTCSPWAEDAAEQKGGSSLAGAAPKFAFAPCSSRQPAAEIVFKI